MFSIIKKLQELLDKLKKRKGLMFTILSVVSIFGIALFMYLIMTLTSSIKSDVYVSIKNNNHQSLENLLENKKNHYKSMSDVILTNNEILTAVQKNDSEKIAFFEKTYNDLYSKASKQPIIIKFYSMTNTVKTNRSTITNLMRSKSTLFGVELQDNGVYVTYIQPVTLNGAFVGLMESKQTIHALKNHYNKIDDFFMFMLDKKMLIKLSLKAKSGKYTNVISEYLVKKGNYTSRFYSKISDLNSKDFKIALKNDYDSDDKFYRSYKVVTDINGAEIGLFVFGEDIEKNNGFISLVENVIKTVTYVSLGLVISIFMFMF
jgi:hypothetical protein